jgi:hypothetical protein
MLGHYIVVLGWLGAHILSIGQTLPSRRSRAVDEFPVLDNVYCAPRKACELWLVRRSLSADY